MSKKLDQLGANLAASMENVIKQADAMAAENLEQARLLGMSGEREADLLGKMGRLERENAELRESLVALLYWDLYPPICWNEEARSRCKNDIVKARAILKD